MLLEFVVCTVVGTPILRWLTKRTAAANEKPTWLHALLLSAFGVGVVMICKPYI